MNIGQILETHLGWAAKGLGEKIQKMLEAQAKVAELREFLDKIYNHDKKISGSTRVDLKQFNDSELLNAREEPDRRRADGHPGVRRRGRGRDQAHARARLPERRAHTAAQHERQDQVTLFDGRTGEPSTARSRSATCTC
jgi:DNA-directed RNA polymerase subunit beta